MFIDINDWIAVALQVISGLQQKLISPLPRYLNDALASGQRQAHQACAIDGHDLVPDIQLPRLLCRPSMHHVGYDHSWQDGSPARLHNHHT